MKLKISKVRPARDREWDSIWSESGQATYFHSREWAEIWMKVSERSYLPSPKLVMFSDGKEALIPLVREKRLKGLSGVYFSSCCGAYGGPISADRLTREHLDLLRDLMLNRLGSLYWRINPFEEVVRHTDDSTVLTAATSVVDLAPGFEALYKGFAHQSRTNIRRAVESRVSVGLAESVDDWKQYFSIYRDSLKRWGEEASSNYPWGLFETIYRLDSPHVRLWLASHEGKAIAGILMFYSKRIAAGWHGAALKDYFELRPVNLLWRQIIHDSCERGYAWLDFGPSGGHEGVLRFKKTFGTEEISCPRVEVTGRLLRWVDWARNVFAKTRFAS